MFNNSLKKEALSIHEKALKEYNQSYQRMTDWAETLYTHRVEAENQIKKIELVVNSVANTPKEYDTKMGNVRQQLINFRKTREYAQEAYDAAVKAGKNIAGGAAAGLGVAAMAPTALMGIATTFGTAATGTAISALSGAAAQKAAVAWLGRTFASFAVTGGTAGMAAGNAFLALAGPVGWGITAASTGVSLITMTNKNKEIADKAVSEAKEIIKARGSLDESATKELKELELTELNEKAENAVAVAVASTAVTGFVPIPFADAPLLIAQQVGLMASICAIYKIDIEKDGLKMLATAAIGAGGAAVVGKTLATNLLKMIPGIGTAAGGLVSGGTAGVVTLAMGKAFIEVCKMVKVGKLSEADLTSSKGTELMKQQFREQLTKAKKN